MKKLNFLFIFCVSIFLSSQIASANPEKIAIGKKVTMDYTTKINGKVVETTTGKKPVVFIFGDGTIIPGLAKKLEGLKAGDQKIIRLKPKEGYGDVIKEAIHEFPLSSFPKDSKFIKGGVIQATSADGQKVAGIVRDVHADKVVIDFNHPYAGKNLEIEVKIVSVQ